MRSSPLVFPIFVFSLLTGSSATLLQAEVKLPAVLGSNMVLQREKPVPIWGWAKPGEKISVSFAGQTQTTTADNDGNWSVTLDPLRAEPKQQGQPLVVKGDNTITLENILIGEVWVCSGQSNMEQGMNMVDNAPAEIAGANLPNVRLFLVPKRPSGVPEKDVSASWQPCSSSTVAQGGWGGFSGVAYYFGRTLNEELQVPVGLIESAWGGTRIEPWTPPAGFAAVPALASLSKSVETAAPGSLNGHGHPTGLYNGMIHPLLPYAIRGAIWYQGEANVGEGMLYHEKMKALIEGWRKVWNQNDRFPFYFVQLAPFSGYGGDALPNIWEAQTATLDMPNTGMAVTTDITGNMGDIHPRNKKDVGRRLAFWALARTYGQKDRVYSGPLYQSMRIEEDKIRLFFAHAGSGLKSRDGNALTHFAIAGKTGAYFPAKAEIDGKTVLVHAPEVPEPARVLFGWSKTSNPNLCNSEGLPAAPFRTENWRGATGAPQGPIVVRAGDPYTVRDIRLQMGPNAKGEAQLFYRAVDNKEFASVPVQVDSAGQMEATIPGEATKRPLEYFVELRKAGRPPMTDPAEGAEAPRKLLPDNAPPSTVADLKTKQVSDLQVTLQWHPATDDHEVVGYRVFRGSENGFETTEANALVKKPSRLLDFADAAPPAGKSVWYAIRAVDGVARTGPAVYVRAEVPANRPPENKLKVSAAAAGKRVFLRWSGSFDPDVVAYELLRGQGKDGELKVFTEIDDVHKKSFVDEKVETDTDYRYAVRLRDRGGLTSPASEPQLVRPGMYFRRINCGGPEFVSEDGVPWEADGTKGHPCLSSGGTSTWNVKEPVSESGPDKNVYQTERWANRHVHYTFEVQPGRYEIVLLLAETNPGFFAKGKRTFDIVLNDQIVAEKVDVFSEAGGPLKPWRFQKTLVVSGRELKIGLVGNPTGPAVKGIEIRGLAGN